MLGDKIGVMVQQYIAQDVSIIDSSTSTGQGLAIKSLTSASAATIAADGMFLGSTVESTSSLK